MNLLGSEIKDKVTGFKGIALERVTYLNGCVQYLIKPRVKKDGKMPNGEWIDEQQLTIASTNVIKKGKSEHSDIELGMTVVDSVTGYKGVVTTKCEYLSGKILYCVKPKIGKDGKMPDGEFINQLRLSVVGKKKTETKQVETGGPLPDYPKGE